MPGHGHAANEAPKRLAIRTFGLLSELEGGETNMNLSSDELMEKISPPVIPSISPRVWAERGTEMESGARSRFFGTDGAELRLRVSGSSSKNFGCIGFLSVTTGY